MSLRNTFSSRTLLTTAAWADRLSTRLASPSIPTLAAHSIYGKLFFNFLCTISNKFHGVANPVDDFLQVNEHENQQFAIAECTNTLFRDGFLLRGLKPTIQSASTALFSLLLQIISRKRKKVTKILPQNKF